MMLIELSYRRLHALATKYSSEIGWGASEVIHNAKFGACNMIYAKIRMVESCRPI